MAHQTGIKASQDLKDKFGEAAGPKIRLIKVQIVDGIQLVYTFE
jgi:hypothetical protein